MEWEIYLTTEVEEWLDLLLREDALSHLQVAAAIEALAQGGPGGTATRSHGRSTCTRYT